MHPEEFHELGKTLMENHQDLCKDDSTGLLTRECVNRVSIDRFYYSAFLIAREWLKQNGHWCEESENDHENVKISIKRCKGLKRANNLAGLIDRLRRDRNKACYYPSGYGTYFTENYVKQWCVNSEIFIKRFI